MRALAQAGERGLRQTDIVDHTGLGAAVIYRLLGGLTENGFVDFDKSNNRYFLGLELLSWAAASTERYGLAPYVDQSLARLSELTGDTVLFSLISGNHSVCVDRREGAYPFKTLTLNIGDHRPLGVGAGSLVILAFQTPEFQSGILKDGIESRVETGLRTNVTIDLLRSVKEKGYAINAGGLIDGMSGVAVPICKDDGTAVAAISIAAISSRLADERLDEIVGLIKQEASLVEDSAREVLNTPFVRRGPAK